MAATTRSEVEESALAPEPGDWSSGADDTDPASPIREVGDGEGRSL